MRGIVIAAFVLNMLITTSCKHNPNESITGTTKENTHSINGTWITVSMEQNGKIVPVIRAPQQIKIFNDGYFSFIMYDKEGKFSMAGAGPFELNGNMFTETMAYCNDTSYINFKDTQKWELKGDTLIFYGFEKVQQADGKDVTAEWNSGGKFVEKRVRAKKS